MPSDLLTAMEQIEALAREIRERETSLDAAIRRALYFFSSGEPTSPTSKSGWAYDKQNFSGRSKRTAT